MKIVSADVLQAVILAKNEEPNIERVLNRLKWLEKVVVLDSFSTDNTLKIAGSFPNVEIHTRLFDTHATQWNHGLSLAGSKWILSLDADYILTTAFINEIMMHLEDDDKSAYFTSFKFLVFGKKLLGDNTTPRPVLFRKSDCKYVDDGHTQRLMINGKTGFFKHHILHDDRKTLSRWLSNQDNYSIKECNKLLNKNDPNTNSVINRIRRTRILAPVLIFFYCLVFKGLIFNGWAGWYYTMQRTIVEMLFALRMIEEEKLNK